MSSEMTIDAEEIGFVLSIEVRKHKGKDVLADITVDEIYSYNYGDESGDESGDERKVFTDEELNTIIVYNSDSIEFGYRGRSGLFRKTYRFPSQKATIKEFVDAIIDFEKITRPMNGAIDRHHIFYEGFEPDEEEEDGPYHIHWGS